VTPPKTGDAITSIKPQSSGGMTTAAPEPLSPSPLVPSWLANLAAVGWRLVAIALLALVVLWLLGVFWVVTASIAVATLIAVVFAPTMSRLVARGRSRNSASLIVFGEVLLVVGFAAAIFVLALLPLLAGLVTAVTGGIEQVKQFLGQESIPAAVSAALQATFETVLDVSAGPLRSIFNSLIAAGTVLILAIFLVFFFVRDGDKAWRWILQWVDKDKHDELNGAARDAMAGVESYVWETTLLGGIAALANFAFMLVLGLPAALGMSIIVFLASFVPYFGSLIATLVVLLIALGAGGPGVAVVMLGLIVLRVLLVRYFVAPRLGTRKVVAPMFMLIALAIGYQVCGLVGLIAAAPIAITAQALTTSTLDAIDPGGEVQLPALIPGWFDAIAQYSVRLLIVVAAAAILIGLIVAFPLVAVPLVAGLVLAATLEPLVLWLVARGWGRTSASALAVGGGLLAIAATIVLAVVALPGNISDIANSVTAGAGDLSSGLGGQLQLFQQTVAETSLAAVAAVAPLVSSIAAVCAFAALSALLGFFFLRDGGGLWGDATGRMPPAAAAEIRGAGRRAVDALGGYMLGTAAVSFVGAASQWLIMVLLGLPYALPVFVLSFLLCFIPYLGGYLTTGMAFLITIQYGTPFEIVLMFTWTMVFNIVQGNVLGPIVMGKTVHIHPAIVLLAVPAGSAVAGIAGMFLAVPAAGVVAATWRSVLKVVGNRADDSETNAPPAVDVSPAKVTATLEGGTAPVA